MTRIYLTEILDEVLGIPEGIVETTKEIYEGIIEDLKKQYSSDSDLISQVNITINNSFEISDYNFNKVNVILNIDPVDDDEIDWQGMAFAFNAGLEKPYKKYTFASDSSTVSLIVDLIANFNTHTWGDIINYLSGPNKAELMSSLAHELKHAFDRFKQKGEPALSMVKYRAGSDIMRAVSGSPGIGEFMFLLYFTTLTENLVRATEVGSYLKYKGTTRKDFLETLKETRVYQHIKQAQNFTYEKMIQDMVSNPRMIDSIKHLFNSNNMNISGLSDLDIVNKFLEFNFSQMKLRSEQVYTAAVKNLNPMMMLFSQFGYQSSDVDEEKEKAIADFKKVINKYSDSDYEKFYRREIAQINFNAEKILRKLAKLYAYV